MNAGEAHTVYGWEDVTLNAGIALKNCMPDRYKNQ